LPRHQILIFCMVFISLPHFRLYFTLLKHWISREKGEKISSFPGSTGESTFQVFLETILNLDSRLRGNDDERPIKGKIGF